MYNYTDNLWHGAFWYPDLWPDDRDTNPCK